MIHPIKRLDELSDGDVVEIKRQTWLNSFLQKVRDVLKSNREEEKSAEQKQPEQTYLFYRLYNPYAPDSGTTYRVEICSSSEQRAKQTLASNLDCFEINRLNSDNHEDWRYFCQKKQNLRLLF